MLLYREVHKAVKYWPECKRVDRYITAGEHFARTPRNFIISYLINFNQTTNHLQPKLHEVQRNLRWCLVLICKQWLYRGRNGGGYVDYRAYSLRYSLPRMYTGLEFSINSRLGSAACKGELCQHLMNCAK